MIALLVFFPILLFCVLAELFGDACSSFSKRFIDLRWRLSNTDISDIVDILKDLRCAVGWHFRERELIVMPEIWKCKRCDKTGGR